MIMTNETKTTILDFETRIHDAEMLLADLKKQLTAIKNAEAWTENRNWKQMTAKRLQNGW